MRKQDPQKRRTRIACVYAFLISVCVLLSGVGFLVADHVNGRLLFGNDYYTVLPTIEISFEWLPPRWQVLWELLQGSR